MTLLRSWGTRIIIYIDDILIMAESAVLASQHLEVLVHILECLGFIINTKKSVMTPMQEIELLGVVVNSNTLLVSLPVDKRRQIRLKATQISNMTLLSARLLSQFLGKQLKLFLRLHFSTAAFSRIYKQLSRAAIRITTPSYPSHKPPRRSCPGGKNSYPNGMGSPSDRVQSK